MEGMGERIEALVDRTTESLRKRFPSGDSPEALGFLGRERRILRGPGETSAGFAERLLTWWDAHATRGGPYALLTQMWAFFKDSNNVPITLIANSGLRHDVDVDGNITQSVQTGWTGDGLYPDKWARIFLIFSLDTATISVPLLDGTGTPVLDSNGDPILTAVSIYALTDAEKEIICAVPREWNAAHIDKIYIILLPPGGYVFGFPPVQFGDPGVTFGGSSLAALFECI